MFRSYFTIAVRGLIKNKLYSAINILGLAVGLASCVMILLFVQDELSYDAWLPNAERVYRLHTRFDIPGRNPLFAVSSPGPAKAALEKDFSEIEMATRLLRQRPVIQRGANVFYEQMFMADPNFFEIIELPFIMGDRSQALTDAASVVISEAMAKKYFGESSPMGQVLSASLFMFGARDLRVTGVFKDLPHNTHLKLDFVARLNESDFEKMPFMLSQWTSVNTWTYIKLKPGVDIEAIRRELPRFEQRSIPDTKAAGREFKTSDFLELSLVKLADLHLKSRGLGDIRDPGDMATVATFSVVALMILLIACINFMNLATARATQRAREVALRKVLGAKRQQLIVQFLGESILVAVISLFVALGLAAMAMPTYNVFLERELTLSVIGANGLALELLGLVVLVGIAGGLYPALYLSRFSPARILKANKSADAEGSGRFRGALVVAQFAISIGLIVCTAVVYSQTAYVRSMNLGFNQSGLLSIEGLRRDAARNVVDALREEMARIPGVTAVARSSETPGEDNDNNTLIEVPGQVNTQPLVIGTMEVDHEFLQTLETPLLAGRFFSREYGGDDLGRLPEQISSSGGNVIVNRRALRLFGVTDPAAAIGKTIRMNVGSSGQEKMGEVTIVGVVEDMQFASARKEIRPMLYAVRPRGFDFLHVRYRNADAAQVRSAAERVWRDLVPAQPFDAHNVQDKVAALYDADETRSIMFAAFAGLAVVIACLGLYGLASFTAERRTKEIGVRKVLGARVRDIVRLLMWDFSKPVLVANVIAWPAAWWLMRDWLNGFEQRVDLSVGAFLAAGSIALLIALVTVALHTARVARSNPIHALRYE